VYQSRFDLHDVNSNAEQFPAVHKQETFNSRCCKYKALDSTVSRMAYNVNLITGKGGKNIGTNNFLRLKIPENLQKQRINSDAIFVKNNKKLPAPSSCTFRCRLSL